MTETERQELNRLLEEIRDVEREHLSEYRRVTQRSLELQEKAVARQEQVTRIYQWALVGAVVLTIGIILLIVYLMDMLQMYR